MRDQLPEDFGKTVLEGVALRLLSLGMGENAEKDFAFRACGSFGRLEVFDTKGNVAIEVIGRDSDEMAEQLALACLHKLSVEELGALHIQQPLDKAIQLQNTEPGAEALVTSPPPPLFSPIEDFSEASEEEKRSYAHAQAFLEEVMQTVALHVLGLGTGDDDGMEMLTCVTGDRIHLRLKNTRGEVMYQVVGSDTDELSCQLALAALHKVSIDQLRALHKQPVKKILETAPRRPLQ